MTASSVEMSRSFSDTAASRSRCFTTQPLLHHIDADEEGSRDILLGLAPLAQGLKGAELIERMERRALNILGERVVLGEDLGRGNANHAWDRRGLGKALLLYEQL
jgi:hypothetical protein